MMARTTCFLAALLVSGAALAQEGWDDDEGRVPRYSVGAATTFVQTTNPLASTGIKVAGRYDHFFGGSRWGSLGLHGGAVLTGQSTPFFGAHLSFWIGPNQVLAPRLKLGLAGDVVLNGVDRYGYTRALGAAAALELGLRMRVSEHLFFELPAELGVMGGETAFGFGLQFGAEF